MDTNFKRETSKAQTLLDLRFKQPLTGDSLKQASNFLLELNENRPTLNKAAVTGSGLKSASISISPQVTVEINQNNLVLIKGARGSLIHSFDDDIILEKKGNILLVTNKDGAKASNFSSQISILYRMLVGVTKGYKEKIRTSGVGYRGVLEDRGLLSLSLGYSHQVKHLLHPTIKTEFSRKNNKMNISGPSLPVVTSSVAEIYHFKKPDVYNGKGIRYRGIKLRKKEGKKQGR